VKRAVERYGGDALLVLLIAVALALALESGGMACWETQSFVGVIYQRTDLYLLFST
jgi:hypothetical protein